MNLIPQTATISQLKHSQTSILAHISEQPLLLLQNSKPVAVMVSPEEWNKIATELHHWRLLAESKRIAAKNDANDSWLSHEELSNRLKAKASGVGD